MQNEKGFLWWMSSPQMEAERPPSLTLLSLLSLSYDHVNLVHRQLFSQGKQNQSSNKRICQHPLFIIHLFGNLRWPSVLSSLALSAGKRNIFYLYNGRFFYFSFCNLERCNLPTTKVKLSWTHGTREVGTLPIFLDDYRWLPGTWERQS